MSVIRTQVAGLYTDNLVDVVVSSGLHLINTIPQDDETAVSVVQTVNLQVVHSNNQAIDNTARVYIEDPVGTWTLAYNEAAGGFQAGFTGTATRKSSPGAAALDELWIALNRTVPWGSLRVIGVRVVAASGGDTLDSTYNFVVEDIEPATITECLWLSPRRCRIRFSESMNTSADLHGTLFHRYFGGGVEVKGSNELYIADPLEEAWEGSYLDLQGSVYPTNCQSKLITDVEVTVALVPTGKVLIDTTELEADSGVDYNSAGKVVRRRALRATIGAYRLQPRLDLEGAGETPYVEERVQCAFAPLVKAVSLPDACDIPSGDTVSQYVVIDFEDDVSLGRWYELHAYNINDASGNNAAHLSLELQTPMFGCPTNRQQLWKFFPGNVQEEDLTDELQLRKMSVVLQDLLNVMWLRADGLDKVLDAWQCPEQLIDHLLYTLGNPFRFPVPTVKQKRRLAEALPELYSGTGIARRVEDATLQTNCIAGMIKFFLGINAVIRPHWPGDTWVLGNCYLGASEGDWPGQQTILGTSSAYLRNSYDVDVSPVILTAEEQRIVRDICTWADPANMHLARIIMGTPDPGAVWILGSAGFSEVGLTTNLG